MVAHSARSGAQLKGTPCPLCRGPLFPASCIPAQWGLKHSETGVGEHSTSVAHLAHQIQAIPTGKQKQIEKSQKYSESSGHHQLSYTLLLMVISISGKPYESILSFWTTFTCIKSLSRAVDGHMYPKGPAFVSNITTFLYSTGQSRQIWSYKLARARIEVPWTYYRGNFEGGSSKVRHSGHNLPQGPAFVRWVYVVRPGVVLGSQSTF